VECWFFCEADEEESLMESNEGSKTRNEWTAMRLKESGQETRTPHAILQDAVTSLLGEIFEIRSIFEI